MKLSPIQFILPGMIADNSGNLWMSFEHAEVYIRIGLRAIYHGPDRLALNTIQIANINMPEKYQKTGVFTRLMTYIQSITAIPVFLENTRLDWAKHLIESHRWTNVREDDYNMDLIMLNPGRYWEINNMRNVVERLDGYANKRREGWI